MTATTAATTAAGARRSGAVFARSVVERRRFAILVGGGVGAFGFLFSLMYESMRESLAELTEGLPEAILAMIGDTDMASATGWLNGELYSLTAPGAVLVVAIIAAGHALPGEEERQTMGLLLANPVSRREVVVQKAAALVVHVVVAAGLITFGTVVGAVVAGLDVSAAGFVGVTLHLIALGVAFGGVALAVGALLGRRRRTMGVTAGLAVAAYAAASFFPLNPDLAGWAEVSPWWYYQSSTPLANGTDIGHVIVLALLGVVATAVAVWGFQRRELA